ncbi:putative Fe-containing alcohol dehydrogenase [Cladophialophora carrionii]|uniref:Putative Fe-containing alcohol dehydrogenase n=1 Tax=Cladophialophora carrionii TaxID=86049 RepID=A0A1C1CMB3_9EURO|nr:putative Fe-containing alcohol dehydrogenase [Cladophialophora carrionii]
MVTPQETYRLVYPDVPNPSPTYISYGLKYTDACARHVEGTFDAKRVYIIASTTLSHKTSFVSDLEQALGPRHVKTWHGIRPHSPWDDLVPIINDMRALKPDLLVTLGGGSLADGAKVIVYALANGVGTVADLEKILASSDEDKGAGGAAAHVRNRTGQGHDPTVPMVFIPTTLSAGEYSSLAGSANPTTHHKPVMKHDKTYARLVILDPALTTTTPEWVWLSTGVRAIDHCVEALCTKDLPAIIRTAADTSLPTLVTTLLRTKRDPTLLQPRLDAMVAASRITVKLMYVPRIFSGCSHGIGHQLGPLGVGHGHTSCVLLPAVLKFNLAEPGQREKQEHVKDLIWRDGGDEVRRVLTDAGLEESTADASSSLRAIFDALGMPSTLKDVGVGSEHFDTLAVNSLDDFCTMANPVKIVDKSQILEILNMVAG